MSQIVLYNVSGKELPSIFGSCLKLHRLNDGVQDTEKFLSFDSQNRSQNSCSPKTFPVFSVNRESINKYKLDKGHYSDSRLEMLCVSKRQIKTPEINQSLLKKCLSASKTGKLEPIPFRSLHRELVLNLDTKVPDRKQRTTSSAPATQCFNAWLPNSIHGRGELIDPQGTFLACNLDTKRSANKLGLKSQGCFYHPAKEDFSPELLKYHIKGPDPGFCDHQTGIHEKLYGKQNLEFDLKPRHRKATCESPADLVIFDSPNTGCAKRSTGLFHPDLLESPKRGK